MSIFSTFQNTHRKSHCSTVATTLVMAALCAATSFNAWAQTTYKLSSKFYEVQFDSAKPWWKGQHRFLKVFCMQFPDPEQAISLRYGMYNNNAIFFSDVFYKTTSGQLAIFVVTSTMPDGRTDAQEIETQIAQRQAFAQSLPDHVRFSKHVGPLGVSIRYSMRNTYAEGKNGPFPLDLALNNHPEAPLRSLSVHRLFVAGGHRIEVSGLQYLGAPVFKQDEAAAIADLASKVEAAASSMEQCTSQMLSSARTDSAPNSQ